MNLDLREKKNWKVKIELSRSKSIMIRYLIFYYLKNKTILPIREDDADDIKIVHDNLVIIDDNRDKNDPDPVVIDVRDCGAGYRFLLSVLAVTEGNWFLTGFERLLRRPIDNLIATLQGCGASIKKEEKGILIRGKKCSAESVQIDCTHSSQFASSLLLISEVIGLKELKIIPEKPASAGYIAMTGKVMEDVNSHNCHIPLPEIERDWSSAAFWYALVALCEGAVCELPGLRKESLQGDCKIADIFDSLKVITTETAEGIVIRQDADSKRDKISKLTLDLSKNPDLTPILAVVGILLQIELDLTGLQNLNYKESRRLEMLEKALSPFATITIIDNKSLYIREIKECRNQDLCFESFQDHRFVMAFALFATKNRVMIQNTEVVSKSYPNFFQDINKIVCC